MKKLYWHNTDSEECFNKHYERFPELFQVYKDKPIEYIMNSDGFRMKFELEPDKSRKVDIFLGCSHTMGSGHYWENTWPYKVAQYTGNEIVNLAVGGLGPESAFYYLVKYFNYFDVQNVFYFQDVVARYDYFDKNQKTHPYSPVWHHKQGTHPYKNWYTNDVLVEDWYIYYNYFKSITAMKGFCAMNKVPYWNINEFPYDSTGFYEAMTVGFFEIESINQEWYENNASKVLIARDGTHAPALHLEVIANRFIRAMKAGANGYIQPTTDKTTYMEKIFPKNFPDILG